ncbi:Cna B-type domain-containing protein, partial [Listeria monocytogenes]|nr:Cna B-type domain-containing protein [Listeria monocytogenes]
IGRNLATSSGNYLTIDENLVGLGSALTEIANKIDKTISSGTITDPMGAGILLQGAGSFDSDNYQLVGWRKDEQGTWVEAPDLVANVQVAEADQTITVSNLALGENERVTLTYQIRLDTEDSSFQGETWVLCNGRTTLVPEVDGEAVDFPIPSIKAPVVSINVLKKWVNVSAAEIPEQIEYQVQRMTTTSEPGWQISDPLTLSKEDDFQVTLSEVPVDGQQLVLPKYNNQGEDFSYTVTEINVPEDFESTVTNDGETIILTNTKKETESSTTEPSTTEPSTTEPSTTEPSTTEPSTTEPSTTEPSTTEPSTTEPSTT